MRRRLNLEVVPSARFIPDVNVKNEFFVDSELLDIERVKYRCFPDRRLPVVGQHGVQEVPKKRFVLRCRPENGGKKIRRRLDERLVGVGIMGLGSLSHAHIVPQPPVFSSEKAAKTFDRQNDFHDGVTIIRNVSTYE